MIVLAIVYLIPTFSTSMMNKELDQRLATISEKTGVPVSVLSEEIFRFDIDLAHRIRTNADLDEETRDSVIEEIESLRTDFYAKFDKVQDGAISLGLDLQGGMHLVLEVNLIELMDNLAKNRDATFNEISAEVRSQLDANPSLDFEAVVLESFSSRDIPMARYFGDPRQSDREILRTLRKNAEEAVELTLTKLRNRVNEFGVSEPSITRQGTRRIVVQLPGVQDPSRARDLIGRTALLEFQIVSKQEAAADVIKNIDALLVEEAGVFGDDAEPVLTTPESEEEDSESSTQSMFSEGSDDTSAVDAGSDFLDPSRPFSSLLSQYRRQIMVLATDRSTIERYLSRSDVQALIPPEFEFLWGHKMETGQDNTKFWMLYLVKERAELTGAVLADAQVTIGSGSSDPTQAGQAIVNLTMKREGTRKFSRITENNIGEALAIVLDNKVHMAPNIRVRIPDGRAIIEGCESVDEANDLAIVLRAGALPAPVEIIEERTVGPSLGADSIRAGSFSAILGLSLVMVFMAIYYKGSGLIADLVLMLNIVFLMAVLGGFNFTLTLPGIAGIILTIGMSVDANVLIFERIREEIRAGKTVWNSVKNGFDRAYITIMDANITTLIAGVVLYQFGTGPIKGFALTLMIGILCSMFTALVVSRAIFDWITANWSVKKLSI
jgi:SecD/SecF fusion protein